jgi:hypothetical protein
MSNYKCYFCKNSQEAVKLYREDIISDIYLYTCEPGYGIPFIENNIRYISSNNARGFIILGNDLIYTPYHESGQVVSDVTITDFLIDYNTNVPSNFNIAYRSFIEVLDSDGETDMTIIQSFSPSIVPTLDTYLERVSVGYSSHGASLYDKYKSDNTIAGDMVEDEDFIDKYLTSPLGHAVITFFVKNYSNTNFRKVQRYYNSLYLPVNLPVGTIISGMWSLFDLPLPPNIRLLNGGNFGSLHVNPYLINKEIPDFTGRVPIGREGNYEVGDTMGDNSPTLSYTNMPRITVNSSGSFTPGGSVTTGSYSGTKNTDSDSHYHYLYGDAAGSVTSSSSTSPSTDAVLNNNDGTSNVYTKYTSSDSHNHNVDITHYHNSTFSGHNGTINVSGSTGYANPSPINVMQKSIAVQYAIVCE